MKERCRRLTADVAAQTVDLLNRNLQDRVRFTRLAREVKTCISCHGKEDRADAFGTMRCNTCHRLSNVHIAGRAEAAVVGQTNASACSRIQAASGLKPAGVTNSGNQGPVVKTT
jgi:hypothetical protein